MVTDITRSPADQDQSTAHPPFVVEADPFSVIVAPQYHAIPRGGSVAGGFGSNVARGDHREAPDASRIRTRA